MSEILRGIAPYPQPKPHKNDGGDCFACALTAVLRHLFPDRPAEFEDVWHAFETESAGGSIVLNNSWHGIERAIYKLADLGYRLDIHTDLVRPAFDTGRWSHAWWSFLPDHEWAYRLEAWLAAGWVALAEMNLDGGGLRTADDKLRCIDHFVVLDGQRQFWQQHSTLPAHSLDHETHVVCSSKGAYWIRTKELLEQHGVAGIKLVRPDRREWRPRA